MLGHLFVGAGAALGGCGFPVAAASASQRGKVLLDRMPQLPKGLQHAVDFPLIEALLGRRARRFSRGAEIPDGALAFKSQHAPLPLSDSIWTSTMRTFKQAATYTRIRIT